MIRIVLVGAAGRMGRAIELAASTSDAFAIKGRVDLKQNFSGDAGVWSDDPSAFLRAGDVAIEFSSPDACAVTARVCAERGSALVSGTTGLSAREEAALRQAAERVAVLRASNFSLGILALRRAIAAALGTLPATWDVEIIERHHHHKADSPSGTALLLARDVLDLRGGGALRHGREGRTGPRPNGEIGVHAVRGGTWAGDHQVLLAGEGEWIEMRHVAQDRGAFAQGALAAARFVAGARPGLYTLEDIIASGGRPA